MLLGFLSIKGFFTLIILAAIFYFGWPLIEATIIALPIPDPKEVKDKITKAINSRKLNINKPTKKPQGKSDGYKEGFNQAPESLEEEEDDDDDDVGKPINLNRHDLNYDSDEEKHHSELIDLNRDRTNTAAERVPKLQKP